MTRGAKIVIFSVVGLFLMAGIYYGFLSPQTEQPANLVMTDPVVSGDPLASETPSLTLTPNSTFGVDPVSTTPGNPGMPQTTIGMDSSPFAPPSAPIGVPVNPALPIVTNSGDPFALNNNPALPAPVIAPAPVMPEPTPAKVATTKPAKSTDDNYTTYVVKSGDTLSAIAGEWFRDVNAWPSIVKANPGLSPSNLKVGQKINLPAKGSAAATRTASSSSSKPSAGKASAKGGSEHVVTKGETLASISDKVYGNRTSWKRIYEANKSVIGTNPSALKVGMKLAIPTKG